MVIGSLILNLLFVSEFFDVVWKSLKTYIQEASYFKKTKGLFSKATQPES